MSRPLTPLPTFHGIASPGRFGKAEGAPGVVIGERVGLGIATVTCRKGQEDALKGAMREAYGVELPLKPVVAQGRSVNFLGYGPGHWVAVSETLRNGDLARNLKARLRGLASISNQSDGRAVIRVSGPRSRDVFAKGLPIDLDPRSFPLGSAATSVIGHMGVQVWQLDNTQSYDIAIFRSVSESFWRWLTSSSAEFGYEVAPIST
ncbi:MAG: sarcosine oxidase subunit gamma [Methyloceanibacter sp.]